MADPRLTKALAQFSDDELIEEFLRRRNRESAGYRDEIRWCDECAHFVGWSEADDPPKGYNPCSLGHEMQFKTPTDYGQTFGFYRRVCPDRLDIDETKER